MSYNAYLVVRDGEEEREVTDWENITFNLHDMIMEASGIDMSKDEGMPAQEFLGKVAKGYTELTASPERYRHLESPNGWGTVEGCKGFFLRCMNMCRFLEADKPDVFGRAVLEISR